MKRIVIDNDTIKKYIGWVKESVGRMPNPEQLLYNLDYSSAAFLTAKKEEPAGSPRLIGLMAKFFKARISIELGFDAYGYSTMKKLAGGVIYNDDTCEVIEHTHEFAVGSFDILEEIVKLAADRPDALTPVAIASLIEEAQQELQEAA